MITNQIGSVHIKAPSTHTYSLFIRSITSSTMSAYKQAGISLTKAMDIAAKAVRNSLKADFRVAAEKRGFSEIRVQKFENGQASESKSLSK